MVSAAKMATVIESVSALDAALKRCNNRPGVVYFRADWVAPCKQCDAVIKALAEAMLFFDTP